MNMFLSQRGISVPELSALDMSHHSDQPDGELLVITADNNTQKEQNQQNTILCWKFTFIGALTCFAIFTGMAAFANSNTNNNTNSHAWPPFIYPLVSAILYSILILIFFIYSRLMEQRFIQVEINARHSSAIVESLFPATIREKLMRSQQPAIQPNELEMNPHNVLQRNTIIGAVMHNSRSKQKARANTNTNSHSHSYYSNNSHSHSHSNAFKYKQKRHTFNTTMMMDNYHEYDAPIAELFANTTVMFADIAGFTAWSSEREPAQVFQLLESIYHSFDVIAKRLGVFKVETIGDCYVAVTGLPLHNKDHAVVMARFAYECLLQMAQLTRELEVILGPGTSDLALRVGLHSGSVIAGVLRGEKSRFQLFGDTMNVASRMESLGARNMIQVSQDTADLIVAAGKQHWLTKRDDVVKAKGKGELVTYWITPRRRVLATRRPTILHGGESSMMREQSITIQELKGIRTQQLDSTSPWENTDTGTVSGIDVGQLKDQRLVDWNTDILLILLSKLVASRHMQAKRKGDSTKLLHQEPRNLRGTFDTTSKSDPRQLGMTNYRSPRQFTKKADSLPILPGQISQLVREQLRAYVGRVAALYRENHFHNFEHASHVALSANKLLKRIIAPPEKADDNGERLSESTYGISSDPLLQFVIVFSALVHDVDHAGVPNAQLVKEKAPVAIKYLNKSVAERHSLGLALKVLKEPQFKDLQACIHPTLDDYKRFRELLVKAVMATDICDKELKLNRQMRWTEAFHDTQNTGHAIYKDNPKATIVVEHIIQASDVAHTMQHWHIFRKWNDRLYNEMYDSYLDGRADTDPGLNWYESEIGFFDFYIIPLAKKLKECGVFGISSDEYLNYALENRLEWERKGKAVTAEMIARRQGHRSSIMKLQDEQEREIADSCSQLASHDVESQYTS